MYNSTLLSFEHICINSELMNEIWSFDPNKLESYSDIQISKYTIALAQYLVYFTSQRNITKAVLTKKKKDLDSLLTISLDKELLKKYKTKKDAAEYMILTNKDFYGLDKEICELQEELIRIDGIDSSISEFIATFKRDTTRREIELQTVKWERR